MMVGVNLIPVSDQLARERRRHMVRWLTAVGVSLVILGSAAGWEWLNRAEASGLTDTCRRLALEAVQARRELESAAARAGRTRRHLERAKALRAKRAWSGMFALVDSCMPPGAWLISVATDPVQPSGGTTRVNVAAPSATGQPARKVTIEAPRKLIIRGYTVGAGDPHVFVTALKETAVFARVSLKRSQREPVFDGFYFRFEVSCEW